MVCFIQIWHCFVVFVISHRHLHDVLHMRETETRSVGVQHVKRGFNIKTSLGIRIRVIMFLSNCSDDDNHWTNPNILSAMSIHRLSNDKL